MQGTPLYSVVMPMYNAVSTVAEAVESVLAQTCADWELLIADDSSTDAGPSIVSTYAAKHSNILLLPSKAGSGGPAGPRNRAIAMARGRYLAFLDADDLWEPEKLERIVTVLLAGADVAYHDAYYFGKGHRRIHRFASLTGDVRKALVLRGNVLCNSATVAVRSRIVALGGFDEREQYNSAEDYDLWLRLARDGARFAHVPEVLGGIRMSEGSLSARHAYHAQRACNVMHDHLQDMCKRGEIGPLVAFHGRQRALASRDCHVGTRMTRVGRDREALALYFSSARHCPWYGYAWCGMALSLARLARWCIKKICFGQST